MTWSGLSGRLVGLGHLMDRAKRHSLNLWCASEAHYRMRRIGFLQPGNLVVGKR
jgi:hypothetical protein